MNSGVLMISDETYKKLLELKNHITVKVREITNEEILKKISEYEVEGVSQLPCPLDELFDPREFDYEPGYNFDEFLTDITNMIWYEQETGKVAFIT